MLIGTNDVSRPNQLGCWNAEEVARGVVAVVQAVRVKLPATQVLLATLPPNHARAAGLEPLDAIVGEVNARLPAPIVDFHSALSWAEVGGAGVLQPDGNHLTVRLRGPSASSLRQCSGR